MSRVLCTSGQRGSGVLLLLVACALFTACDRAPSVIEIELNEEGPVLPGPYTRAELQAMLDGFSWEHTEPWPETDGDGRHLFYYAEMLVPHGGAIEDLDDMGLDWDYLPLFDEELAPWDVDAPSSSIDFEWIPEGRLVFAVIPGLLYNEVRATGLAGEPVWPLIRRRMAPARYLAPDGSLVLERLRDAGAFSRDLEPLDDHDDQKFVARMVRGLVRAVRGVAPPDDPACVLFAPVPGSLVEVAP